MAELKRTSMKKLRDAIIRFFHKQPYTIVTTIDRNGCPHNSCKGIVDIEEGGRIYLLDLYKEKTYENLKVNPHISITAVDEHKFIGYSLKGEAKAAIIASGKRSRELGVPGEREFKNKGLTYCATCDGPLFSGKDVAVIGGGNSALDAVLQLMKIANKVYVINVASELTGDIVEQEKIKKARNAVVFNNSHVTAVLGDKMVAGIKIKREGKEETFSVQGVFVEIGLLPNSGFVSDVEKNDRGEIKVDSYNRTSVAGIFAAGDVTDVPEKQIIIAAGEGAKATLGAFRYLSKLK